MIFAAIPPRTNLRRRIRVPPSKSVTNRALVIAALSPRPFRIESPLDCDDTDAMLAGLRAAGAAFESVPGGFVGRFVAVPSREAILEVRDSGTACRFLTAFAASADGGTYIVTGSPRLQERPVGGLVDALRHFGAQIEYAGKEGFPPLRIRGRRLSGGAIEMKADQSSQFASALLLCAVRFEHGLDLSLAGPAVSLSYLETTRESLALAGVPIDAAGLRWVVPAGASVHADELRVPGDYSSALPLACAAAVAGGEVSLENLPWPSTQADARAFEILEQMGTQVRPGRGVLWISGAARRPISLDASAFPDAVPALAAVAARVEGESEFSGIGHLRLKESDRVAAIVEILRCAGIQSSGNESLHISGRAKAQRPAGVFPTRGDHRIVIAAVLLSLSRGGLVENPRAVGKSYPGFFRDLFS